MENVTVLFKNITLLSLLVRSKKQGYRWHLPELGTSFPYGVLAADGESSQELVDTPSF